MPDPTTANPQPLDPSNPITSAGDVSQTVAALQAQGLPMPAGTTENGEPYWIINGEQIMWAQMQQYLWEQQQKAAAARPVSSGGGLEQMPVMPTFNPEVALDTGNETRVESGPEFNPEKKAEQQETRIEQAIEKAQQQTQTATNPQPQQKAPKADPIVGDSAKMATVDLSSVPAMHDFYIQHNQGKGDPQKSNTFLATLLGRLLRSIFSADAT